MSTANQRQRIDGALMSGLFRATRRQALSREVNENIERLSEEWGAFAGAVSVLCECGNPGCLERIEVAAADYEAVRRFPIRFIVKPGHIAGEGERVVRESSECVVVEKFGPAAGVAVRLDPRRRAQGATR